MFVRMLWTLWFACLFFSVRDERIRRRLIVIIVFILLHVIFLFRVLFFDKRNNLWLLVHFFILLILVLFRIQQFGIRAYLLIGPDHRLKLYTTIHFLDVSEMPATINIPLLRKHLSFSPVFKEGLSVEELLAGIYDFQSFLGAHLGWNRPRQRNDRRRSVVHEVIFSGLGSFLLILRLRFHLCTVVFILILCLFHRSRSGSGALGHDFFNCRVPIAILPTLATLLIASRNLRVRIGSSALRNNHTFAVDTFDGVLVSVSNEGLDVGDGQCTSSVSTQ